MFRDPEILRELRASTALHIEEEPTPVALIRTEMVRTPEGGVRRSDPQTLDPVFRFFGGVRADPRIIVDDNGERLEAQYVLIGLHGDDIRKKDEFVIGTDLFMVGEIHPDRSFQTKAWVIRRGSVDPQE